MEMRRESESKKKKTALWLLYLTIATLSFLLFIQTDVWATNLELPPELSQATLRPFVYRVFTPLLIKSLMVITPFSGKTITYAVIFLSIIGFLFAFSMFSKLFVSNFETHFLTLTAPIAIIPMMLINGHSYDFPNLFLFTLALYFLASQKWIEYLIVFPFVTLSKETSVLLIFLYLLNYRNQLRPSKLFTLLFAQIAIYFPIRIITMWVFRDNPGDTISITILSNIGLYKSHAFTSIAFLIFIFIIVFLSNWKIRSKPPFLRNAEIAIALPIFVLFIFAGWPYEIRVFYEAFPILYLLCWDTIKKTPFVTRRLMKSDEFTESVPS
jgi:hypothetical protein